MKNAGSDPYSDFYHFRLDPDLYSDFRLDPDRYSVFRLDPDPYKTNTDLKHCRINIK